MKDKEFILLDVSMRDVEIKELYAFIAVNKEGKEGICGFGDSPNEIIPMVFSDPELIENMKVMAKHMVLLNDIKIKFMKFINPIELDVIELRSRSR